MIIRFKMRIKIISLAIYLLFIRFAASHVKNTGRGKSYSHHCLILF